MAALHVAATAATEVLVVAVVEHVDPEAHRVHIRMHEVFTDAHQATLLLLRYFHKMLGSFPEYFVEVLLLLVEAALNLLIKLFKQFLLLGLDLRTDCPVIRARVDALRLHQILE